jgi:hypothetical protein
MTKEKSIYRQQEFDTKSFGKVRIVKQETKDSGGQTDNPGKVRVRILETKFIQWIDFDELIFPEKNPPMTGREKKAKSDQVFKEMGYKNMTFKISPENHEKINQIKEQFGFSNWNDLFNHLVENFKIDEL